MTMTQQQLCDYLLARITAQPRTQEALRCRAVQDHLGVRSSDVRKALRWLYGTGAIEQCVINERAGCRLRIDNTALSMPKLPDSGSVAAEVSPVLEPDHYLPRLLSVIGELAGAVLDLMRPPKPCRQVSGGELRTWRLARGLSQSAFWELVGYSENYLCRIETGRRPVPPRLAALVTG